MGHALLPYRDGLWGSSAWMSPREEIRLSGMVCICLGVESWMGKRSSWICSSSLVVLTLMCTLSFRETRSYVHRLHTEVSSLPTHSRGDLISWISKNVCLSLSLSHLLTLFIFWATHFLWRRSWFAFATDIWFPKWSKPSFLSHNFIPFLPSSSITKAS